MKNCLKILLSLTVILMSLFVCKSVKADMPASQTGVTCSRCGSGMRAECGRYNNWLYCESEECGYSYWQSFNAGAQVNSPYHSWQYDRENCTRTCGDCGLTDVYEPPCEHGFTTYVYDASDIVSYTNAGPYGHYITVNAEAVCSSCGTNVPEQNAQIQEYQLHACSANGLCICGYCEHLERYDAVDPTSRDDGYTGYNTRQHRYEEKYIEMCRVCGNPTGASGSGSKWEAHTLVNGQCVCGYVCQHYISTHHYDSTIPPIIVNTTATTHTVKNGYKAICDDCGTATGETGYFDAATREHTFTNGVCLCGYIQPASPTTPVPGVCSHNYVINRDKPVSGSERYTYDNSKHTRVSVRYEQYCSKCGAKGPESGDVSDNTSAYHWFTEGYTHGTDEHWFTDTTCNGRCGYTRYENRKPHTYENGVCSTCGARAQNCQHEMVAEAEPEQVISQYDLDDWMHTGSHRVEMITYEVCQKCGYRVESEDQALAIPKSHKFEGDTCQLCGYSNVDEFFSLLASIPDSANPLENETVADILWGEFAAAGMNRDEIREIFELVKKAPKTYRDLYLYSFFDYGMEIVKDPSDPDAATLYMPCKEDPNGTFEEDGKRYSVVNTVFIDYEKEGILPATWFHETGHAIEDNYYFEDNLTLWGNNLYIGRENAYQKMDDDVRHFISLQATSEDHPLLARKWNALTTDEQEQIYRSIIGSEVGYPESFNRSNETWTYDRVSLNSELQAIQDELVGNMIAAVSVGSSETRNAYMVTDCLEGMTNGLVSGRENAEAMDYADMAWNWWNTSEIVSGHMRERPTYWHKADGKPTMEQGAEAWAEYYSAVMTGNQDAINSNLYYFPETCAYFDSLAAEMLAHYKEQARAQ